MNAAGIAEGLYDPLVKEIAVRAIRPALLVLLTAAISGYAAPAGATSGLDGLASALGTVNSTAHFGVRDSQGVSMDTLKVVQGSGGKYLGVYHSCATSPCQVRVATSTDLTHWTYVRTLDASASQPYLRPYGRTGWILAVEEDTHHTVKLSHFSSQSGLLGGTPDKVFNTPHTLSRCAEGTPTVTAATSSEIDVHFHYFSNCTTDREASGVLRNWTTWTTTALTTVDSALSTAGAIGKHGDRDSVPWGGAGYEVFEGQAVNDDNSTWGLYAYDPNTGSAVHVPMSTPGGSRSFANPAVTRLTNPAGQSILFVSVFLPVEGIAGTDGAGQLTYQVPAA
jgi:hypothetical protein